MKLAVLSDIHANMEAFEAVLNDMETASIDAIISLGDNIGYGPEPEKVINYIQENSIPSVLGNHEYVFLHKEHINSFNANAGISILKTMDWLSQKSVDFIKTLPGYIIAHECRFVHGTPPDSPLIYLYEIAGSNFEHLFSLFTEPICFLGHTHQLDMFSYDGKTAKHHNLIQGKFQLEKNRRYVINVGSVGQPRDNDKNAKYVIWDIDKHIIDVRFTDYDVEATAKKIKAAGLPLANALRLW